jgi:hypothetical protein
LASLGVDEIASAGEEHEERRTAKHATAKHATAKKEKGKGKAWNS